jgi:hypothetical protein
MYAECLLLFGLAHFGPGAGCLPSCPFEVSSTDKNMADTYKVAISARKLVNLEIPEQREEKLGDHGYLDQYFNVYYRTWKEEDVG